MTATRLWMVGCIAFAGLSVYLMIELFGTGFNNYASDVQFRFVSAQRDVLFKLIPRLQPPLEASAIENAAKVAKISISQRTPTLIVLSGGVAFDLAGTAVNDVRSVNF
jgi:hypothetical protein